MPEIAIIGATLSGNKGAASMLQSGVENISRLVENPHFNVLSIYPEEDRKANRDGRVEIVSAKPLALLMAVPLASLWWLLARLHLPLGPLRRNRILTTLKRSDLLIDMGGISFSDGRGIVLIYNVACLLPALLMGTPVMKYSQALGPFKTFLNRRLAKALLPRLAVIAARGEITLDYLQELGLTNVVLCADAAFALDDVSDTVLPETSQIIQTLDRFEGRKLVGIAASSVVRAYCQRRGIDYCQVLADFADQLTDSGDYGIWLVAHAVRRSKKGGRTSDVDTCQTIYNLMKNKSYCQLVVEDYPPATLRTIIGTCDYFIASRFHAMVSALAKGVPTLVTAWSHKYREVLAMFDMEEWTIGHQALTTVSLLERFETLVRHENEVRARIARHLPDVMRSSRQNARLAASLLGTTQADGMGLTISREGPGLTENKSYNLESLMMRAADKLFGGVPDEATVRRYLGQFETCYLGYANQEELRVRAASGGLVSAVLIYLLERDIIQGALISRIVTRDGLIEAEPFIAQSRQEILSSQSSIYMEFPLMREVRRLAEKVKGHLAIVALPCHLQRLRRWEERDPALAEKISLRIGLVCGRSSSKELLLKVLGQKGVREQDVAAMLFRQGHWRGVMKLWLRDGQEISFPFQDFSIYRNLHFECEMRCLHCEDPLGDYADLTCGDAWLPELKQHPVKHSIAIARTPEAAAWLDQMIRENYLTMQRVPPETIFRAQRRGLIPMKRGKAAKARLSRLFGLKMNYDGPWRSRWNDYLVAAMVLLNYRLSRSERLNALVFKIPKMLLRAYLMAMSLLKNC